MALINNGINDIPGIISLFEETDAVNSEKDFRKQLEITNQLSWSGSPRWSACLCDGSLPNPLLPPLCVRVCVYPACQFMGITRPAGFSQAEASLTG